MSRVRMLSRRASRRAFARELVGRLGVWLTWSLVVGLLLALTDRLIGPGVSVWWPVGASAASGVVGAVVSAARRAPGSVGAAAEVDAALGLRDRISSAVQFESRGGDDPFEALAREDAEARARGVRLASAMPIRLDGWWLLWPLAAAAAIGVGMLMPAMRLLERLDDGQRAAMQQAAAQRDAAAEEVRRAAEELEQLVSDEALREGGEAFERLREIEEQLRRGEKGADEARAESASAMEELARQREAEAERAREQLDALESRLAGLEEGAESEEMRRLEDALRRGDFEAAQEAMEALRRRLEEAEERGDSEEWERLAGEMQQMAQRLADAAEERGAGSPSEEQDRQALREQGMSESAIEQMMRETDARELERQMREQGMDPEQARRMAERMSQNNSLRASDWRAQEQMRELSEQMSRDAQQMRSDKPTAPRKHDKQGQGQCQNVGGALGRMNKQGQRSTQAQGEAEAMRRAAEEMLRQMGGPDGGLTEQDWARQLAMEMAPQEELEFEGREDINAQRGATEGGGQVVGERTNPNRGGEGVGTTAPTPERVREAARSVERAIEEQRVPRGREDVVRKYFGRLPERASPARDAPPAGEGEAPAQPAEEEGGGGEGGGGG